MLNAAENSAQLEGGFTPDNFLTLAEVRRMVGLGKTAIYDRIGDGTFPRQIPLGGKTVRWSENEVRQWQAQCFAARSRSSR